MSGGTEQTGRLAAFLAWATADGDPRAEWTSRRENAVVLAARLVTLETERDEARRRYENLRQAKVECEKAAEGRVQALEAALTALIEMWDMSADVLGPEWIALAERMESLRAAVLGQEHERAAVAAGEGTSQ